MTHDRDIDRVLTAWLHEGPNEVADRVLDSVADRIGHQAQRPAWRLTWRETPVNANLKPLAALVAVLVIAVLGIVLITRPVGTAGPGPAPTPTAAPTAAPTVAPTPTPTPAPSAAPSETPAPTAASLCIDPAYGCAGELAAGTIKSTAFDPAVSFSFATDGWVNTLDRARSYYLQGPGHTFDLQVLSEVAIPEQNTICSPARRAGTGTGVNDFITFIAKHPGLTASKPESVTVGGYKGKRIAFNRAPDWTATCPDSLGPAIMLLTDTGTPPTRSAWIDDQYTTWWVLDVRGKTVIISLSSGPSDTARNRDQATVQPVIDSITFPGG